MAEAVRVKNIGLRGVTVADTKISFIDGEKGILIYRGYRIEELAERSSYMETAYLLLNGNLPSQQQLEAFTREVVEAREIPEFLFESFKTMASGGRAHGCSSGVRADSGHGRPGFAGRNQGGRNPQGDPSHLPPSRCGGGLAQDQEGPGTASGG